ncbi:MAG: hypothetical protein ACRENI_14300, partial [Gemmatimonadaceae bacterium]
MNHGIDVAVASPSPRRREVTFRFTGPLASLSGADRAALFDRTTSRDTAIRARTAGIIDRVRTEGDAALRLLARELDGIELDQLEL